MLCFALAVIFIAFIPETYSIVGGKDAPVEKYPFVVSLCDACTESAVGTFRRPKECCTGTILSPDWILSASNCLGKNVWYGRSSMTDCRPELMRQPVKRFDIHLAPNVTNSFHLTLIKLNQAIVFNKFAAPVRLPNADFEIPQRGKSILVGFGLTPPLPDSPIMQEVEIDILGPDFLPYMLPSIASQNKFFVSVWSGKMHRPAGACDGDRGGPMLIHDSTGSLLQVGVETLKMKHSVGTKKCQAPNHISVAVKTNFYIEDIERITGLKRNSSGYLVWPKKSNVGEVIDPGKIVLFKGTFTFSKKRD